MKATRPARALVFLVDMLDRSWGFVALLVVVVLEAVVLAPRSMTEAMIGGGSVAAGLLVGWLWGGSA